MSIKEVLKTTIDAGFRPHEARFLERPVFVVACGRSGSTALCRALGEHPHILMVDAEGPLVSKIGDMAHAYALGPVAHYFQYSVQIGTDAFRAELKRLCQVTSFGSNMGFIYNPMRIKKENSVYRHQWPYQSWGIKAFPGEASAQGLLWLYPEARFVYLFRNGLDVVHSMSKFGSFAELSFADRCRFWADRVFLYEYLRQHEKAVTVRFENFVTDNAAVLEVIYAHLGIAYDPAPAAFASTTMVHPLDGPTEKINPAEALSRRRKGYEDWDETQKRTFKEICSEAMGKLEYEIPF